MTLRIDPRLAGRIQAHTSISTALAVLSDAQLQARIESAVPAHTGIGGRSVRMAVAEQPVFVKLVPLTALELLPQHRLSTTNLFGLPTYFQYGIGSVGFGAWRELAAHMKATEWVLSGASPAFPLLHHWRVLPALSSLPFSSDEPDYFAGAASEPPGAPEIRARFEAVRCASTHLALFLEHFPHNLSDWLGGELAAGGERADHAVGLVEQSLVRSHTFLAGQAWVHFDAHFQNMLTDGNEIYLSDFGLVSCERFDLANDERAFLRAHADYDRCRSATALMHNIVTGFGDGSSWTAQLTNPASFVASCQLSVAIRDVALRYAPVAAAMLAFSRRLRTDSKLTPWPAQSIAQLLQAADSGRSTRDGRAY